MHLRVRSLHLHQHPVGSGLGSICMLEPTGQAPSVLKLIRGLAGLGRSSVGDCELV